MQSTDANKKKSRAAVNSKAAETGSPSLAVKRRRHDTPGSIDNSRQKLPRTCKMQRTPISQDKRPGPNEEDNEEVPVVEVEEDEEDDGGEEDEDDEVWSDAAPRQTSD